MALSINEAVDLFLLMWELAFWAVGIICVAYLIKVIHIMAQQVNTIRFNWSARRSKKGG